MNFWESVSFVFLQFFFNEVSNFVLAFLLLMVIFSLFFLAVTKKKKFDIFHRIGFVFVSIGFLHNITQRLVFADLFDPFLLINVPVFFGFLMVQMGVIFIMLGYVFKIFKGRR
jgi:hypothetical protein